MADNASTSTNTDADEAADVAADVDGQLTLDDADTAAGYRSILDPDDDLPADDPNAAACTDDTADPAALTGEDVNPDPAVEAALAQLRATYGPDGDLGIQPSGAVA